MYADPTHELPEYGKDNRNVHLGKTLLVCGPIKFTFCPHLTALPMFLYAAPTQTPSTF